MSRGSLFKVSENGQNVRPFWDLHRGRRTLSRCMVQVGPYLYIGDYWANPQREAVNIYRIDIDSGQSEIFYQFPAGSVRHIHTLAIDHIDGRLWLSTGDEDEECQVAYLDLDSGQLDLLGEGRQKWRTVSFIFRQDAIYWGTDNPIGENQIWRYDRTSGKLQEIGTVLGPVYYSNQTDAHLIFGTAVEYGEGHQDGFGRLYAAHVGCDNSPIPTHDVLLKDLHRQAKDGWHARYFGYGLFELNTGNVGENRFWATQKGLKGGLRSILFEVNS